MSSKHPNIQTSKHPNIQTSKHPNIQTSKHPNIQTPKHPNIQTPKHPNIHQWLTIQFVNQNLDSNLQDIVPKQFVHLFALAITVKVEKSIWNVHDKKLCVYRTPFVSCKYYTMHDERQPCRHRSLLTPICYVLCRIRHTSLCISWNCVCEIFHRCRHSRPTAHELARLDKYIDKRHLNKGFGRECAFSKHQTSFPWCQHPSPNITFVFRGFFNTIVLNYFPDDTWSTHTTSSTTSF